MRNTLAICLFISCLGISSVCFGQSIDVSPAATLEEFRENLRPYDPFLIQLTVNNESEWQTKIDAIRERILIESVEEEPSIRSDWLILTMNLQRVGDSETPYQDGWRYRESYTVVYTPKSAGELERDECQEHEIKERAPFGFIWRPVSETDSKHRCLELAPQSLLLGKRTYMEGTLVGETSAGATTIEVDVFTEFDGTVVGEYWYSGPNEDFDVDVECYYAIQDEYFVFTGPIVGEEAPSGAIWAFLEIQNPTTQEPDGQFRLSQRDSEVATELCKAREPEVLGEAGSSLRIQSGEIDVYDD